MSCRADLKSLLFSCGSADLKPSQTCGPPTQVFSLILADWTSPEDRVGVHSRALNWHPLHSPVSFIAPVRVSQFTPLWLLVHRALGPLAIFGKAPLTEAWSARIAAFRRVPLLLTALNTVFRDKMYINLINHLLYACFILYKIWVAVGCVWAALQKGTGK